MEPLENILAGKGEAAPAPEKPEAVQPQPGPPVSPQPQEGGEPHDEVIETDGKKLVPLEALTAARGKAKRYTEQVADFEKRVGTLTEQNAHLSRQVSELLQRIPTPQQPQQQAPDFFENPAEATKHLTSSLVTPQFEQINQAIQELAKETAIVRYTEEKVGEAERAFIGALQSRTLDPADYQAVVNSKNRYAAAVQWHQRQLAKAEIGDDPAAFKARVEAEILEKYGLKPGAAPGNGGAAPAVMPSNLATARNVGQRSGPAWSGPPTLQDIFKR